MSEEFLAELRGRRGMRVYREMRDNSPIVGACMSAIRMLIGQVSWWVEPASESTEDKRYAEHVETCRGDMSHTWTDFLGEALSMLTYGFAPHEIVLKRRGGDVNDPTARSRYTDGLIGWRKLPLRGQETVFDWLFDDAGGIQGFRQQAPPDYKVRTLPIGKVALFRASTEKNNPEGASVLRNTYNPYYYAKKIQQIEAVGIERDLAGIPTMGIPSACFLEDATPEQKQTLANARELVTETRRDEEVPLGRKVLRGRDEPGRRPPQCRSSPPT